MRVVEAEAEVEAASLAASREAAANFGDDAYLAAGARIAASAAELYGVSDLVFRVRAPSPEDIAQMKPGSSGSRARSVAWSTACGGRSRAPHRANPWRAIALNILTRRRAASDSG